MQIWALSVLLLMYTPWNSVALAKGLKIALVAKNTDDVNFIEAGKSCAAEARKYGDECVLLGEKEGGSPRAQVIAIEAAVKTGTFSAFAISVTKSDLVAKVVQKIKVPVITFDSPFESSDSHLSRAYIGANNLDFGKDLGRVAKRLRPKGGTICIMTAMHDTNLKQRVWGLRQELSGNPKISIEKSLSGENGWTEIKRCPLNTGDNVQRSLSEMGSMLESLKPDVFVSVGSWPIKDDHGYRSMIAPYHEEIQKQHRTIIFAPGLSTPSYTNLMHENLVHGYVIGNFPEIGKLSYLYLRDILLGKSVPPITYIPNTIRITNGIRTPDSENILKSR